jgi:hypothetical protein
MNDQKTIEINLDEAFPHRHLDPVEMTDSFVELVEEVPIDICIVDDNTVYRYSDPFYVPTPPKKFFHRFRAYYRAGG